MRCDLFIIGEKLHTIFSLVSDEIRRVCLHIIKCAVCVISRTG